MANAKFHHTQIKYLNSIGLAPIVDDGRYSVALHGRLITFDSPKTLVQHLKDLDAAGQLTAEVSEPVPERAKSGMVYSRYKRLYDETDGLCGDDLAVLLREATTAYDDKNKPYCDIDLVIKIAAENGVQTGGKNPGHFRMNLSNILRARLRHGKRVVIDGVPVATSAKLNQPKRAAGVISVAEAAIAATIEAESAPLDATGQPVPALPAPVPEKTPRRARKTVPATTVAEPADAAP